MRHTVGGSKGAVKNPKFKITQNNPREKQQGIPVFLGEFQAFMESIFEKNDFFTAPFSVEVHRRTMLLSK